MNLNHVNLTVTDVDAASEFLQKYFGLRCRAKRGDSFAMLLDDDATTALGLMKGKKVEYPATFHVGFIQESEERVNEINQQLKDDGFDVKSPGRIHGAWSFYFRAPGGFLLEVEALSDGDRVYSLEEL